MKKKCEAIAEWWEIWGKTRESKDFGVLVCLYTGREFINTKKERETWSCFREPHGSMNSFSNGVRFYSKEAALGRLKEFRKDSGFDRLWLKHVTRYKKIIK